MRSVAESRGSPPTRPSRHPLRHGCDTVIPRGFAPLLAVVVQVATVDAQQPVALRLGHAVEVTESRFTFLTSVRELGDGRLLVADPREGGLLLIDRQGSTEVIGRRGDGPGEYRAPLSIMPLGADSSLVVDHGSRRWLLLSGDDVVATVPAFEQLPTMLGLFWGQPAASDSRGHVIGVGAHRFLNAVDFRSPATADSLVLLLGDRATGSIDTIAVLDGPGSDGVSWTERDDTHVVVLSNPLAAVDQAILFEDGWLAVVRAEPYGVEWRRPDGRWVIGTPIRTTPTPADDAERCLAIERYRLRGESPCDPSALRGWPDFVPPFLFRPDLVPSLLATPRGHVAIARTPTTDSAEPRYDIVSRSGTLVATLVLEAGQSLVGFGTTDAYVVTTDDFDLQRLTRHSVAWDRLPSSDGGLR